jgi:hypothetical protein
MHVSDQKTRIIPRQSPAPASTEPQRVGDKIVFFCPNGDRVVVPAKLAGKRGLCTKCKVPVVIPSVGPKPTAFPLPDEAVVGREDEAEPEGGPVEEAAAEPPAEEIVAEPPQLPPLPAAAAPPTAAWGGVGDAEASSAGLDFGLPSGTAPAWSGPPPEPPDGAEHPAARLVARLWLERGHSGVVELHLSGGSVILPEWYEAAWSRGTHGLFASQAVDGSVTLTAVAWDTIEKIVVRQVQGLPDGMFE